LAKVKDKLSLVDKYNADENKRSMNIPPGAKAPSRNSLPRHELMRGDTMAGTGKPGA
jgi:hypothetical protein